MWTFYNSNGEALVQHAESEATQAEMEAETAVAKFVPPDLVKNSPGVAKGWVKFDMTASDSSYTGLVSYNVAGLTDQGVGDWDIEWTTDFSTAHYSITAVGSEFHSAVRSGAASAGVTSINAYNSSHAAVDDGRMHVTVHGVQS